MLFKMYLLTTMSFRTSLAPSNTLATPLAKHPLRGANASQDRHLSSARLGHITHFVFSLLVPKRTPTSATNPYCRKLVPRSRRVLPEPQSTSLSPMLRYDLKRVQFLIFSYLPNDHDRPASHLSSPQRILFTTPAAHSPSTRNA